MTTTATQSIALTPQPNDFNSDVTVVARQIRAALSELISSSGMDLRKPQALAQKWGVNKQLSWQISKVVQSDDPFQALRHLPGKQGLEIMLNKGKVAGASDQLLSAVREALDRFESIVALHCDDRATFELMASDFISGERVRQQHELIRKQFFRGASAIWGAQVRVNFRITLIVPAKNPPEASQTPSTRIPWIDLLCVSGLLDFRRLRKDLSWVLWNRILIHDDGTPVPESARVPEALDRRSAGQPFPLLGDFCSQPAPEINVVRNNSTVTAVLPPGMVGNAGLFTCVTGVIFRSLPHFHASGNEFCKHVMLSRVPAELLLYDFYVHESIDFAIPPTLYLRSLVGGEEDFRSDDSNRLPLHEPLISLGAPAPAPVTPDVPRYSEMIATIFERTQWTPGEFRGFRCHLPYPPIPAALVMRYAYPGDASRGRNREPSAR